MAVGGGACSAYRLSVVNGATVTKGTTCLRSECVRPDQAVERVLAGEAVVVEGREIVNVRNAVEQRMREATNN